LCAIACRQAFSHRPTSARPPTHFADDMQAGFLGTGFHWSDVLVVGGWGLARLVVAARYFSWEPRV